MFRQRLLFLLLLIPFYCTSQMEYRLFDPEESYMFQDEEGYFHAIKWDSVYIGDVTDYLFNFKTFRMNDLGYYSDKENSWLGYAVRQIYGNEYGYIMIHPGEEVEIKTGASLGETFPVYYYPGGDIIWASLEAHQAESFLGVQDSVKTFSFQKKTASGELLDHSLNEKTIKVSKNYGMIKALSFTDFPDGPVQSLQMTGSLNNGLGMMQMRFNEAFGLAVGDEIHEQRYSSTFQNTFTGKYIHEVLDVAFNTEETVVNIEVKRCGIEKYFEEGDSSIQFFNDTIVLNRAAYNGAEEPCFQFPEEYPEIPFHDDPRTFAQQYQTGEYNNRRIKSYGMLFQMIDPENWMPYIDYYCADYYIEGVGQYYHFFDPGGEAYLMPVYFKKGNETWGVPFSCDDLTSVEEVEIPKVEVYPNPATTNISIHSEVKNFQFKLYDGKGELKLSRRILSSIEILSIESLPPGNYFYELEFEKGRQQGKLIITR
jgi:hypothetical protein